MPIPLSQFEKIARLVVERQAALERLERYGHLSAVTVYFQENGTGQDSLPDPLLVPIRNLLIEHATRELAAIDEELRSLGFDPEA